VSDQRPALDETATREAQADVVQDQQEQQQEDPITTTTTSQEGLVTAELVDEPVEAVPMPCPDPEAMQTEDASSTLAEDNGHTSQSKRWLCVFLLLIMALAAILVGVFVRKNKKLHISIPALRRPKKSM